VNFFARAQVVSSKSIDVACTLPEKELVRYLTRLGPVGVILQEADDRTRTQAAEGVNGEAITVALGGVW
jgi:hypothetical protein